MFKNNYQLQNQVSLVLIYFFLLLVGFTTLLPLLWMFATSLMNPHADVVDLAKGIFDKLHWENYRVVLIETNFLRAFLNSFIVTLLVTTGQVATSAMAAYAFARMKFFGRDHIFMGYLATLMIPSAVTMIPVFIILRKLGLINTYSALILPSVFSAYGTFMLRQFFITLPWELEEAAMLDGCGSWQIFCHVILPLSRNALVALAILTFMGTWKSFMWPLIVTHSEEIFTMPIALSKFREMYGIQWALLMAGSVIMVLPMLIVFIIGQKLFIKGVCLGGVKG